MSEGTSPGDLAGDGGRRFGGRWLPRLDRATDARTGTLVVAGGLTGVALILLIGTVLIATGLVRREPVGPTVGTGGARVLTPTAEPAVVLVAPVGAPPEPLDLAVLHATAEAVFTLTPGARPPATPTPATKPSPRPPTKPQAAAKPASSDVTPQAPPPVKAPEPPSKPATAPSPPATPTPEPTGPPTWTPTITLTATDTPTSTATPTMTPTPGPCEARIEVPRLAGGNGYYRVLQHEGFGRLAIVWPVDGGRILLYEEKPPEFDGSDSGLAVGVPTGPAIAQGTSGASALHVPDRPPGAYTVYFYAASAVPVGPVDALVTYFTIGHCP